METITTNLQQQRDRLLQDATENERLLQGEIDGLREKVAEKIVQRDALRRLVRELTPRKAAQRDHSGAELPENGPEVSRGN